MSDAPGPTDHAAATSARPDREMRVEVAVAAPPERVWAVLTDLGRMPQWSPELVRMVALRPGGLRLGQWYAGLNRRGPVLWPTRNVVVGLEPGRLLAWETTTSGARWIWEVHPDPDAPGLRTRLVHRRVVRHGLTRTSGLFAGLLLGGADGHADELEEGMERTARALAAAAEAGES